MEIQERQVGELTPYINNARTHSEDQVDQIVASIQEFGFTNPILLDSESGIIAGHGRVLAAQKMGMKAVPTIALPDLSDEQKRAYILADNKLAMNAGWDEDMLKKELISLEEMGVALGIIGFSEDELDDIMGLTDTDGETDPDEIPELSENIKTKPGDLWTMGDHRLLCGDSTSIEHADHLMNGQKADLVWTDPPYNVAYEGQAGMTIKNDNMDDGKFLAFLTACFAVAFEHTKKGRPMYIAHADSEGANFRTAMKASGFLLKQCLVWVKNSMVLGRQDYQWQHEPILYGWKPGESHKWYGRFDKKTVLDDDIDVKKLDKKQLIQIINDLRNETKTTVIRQAKPTSNDLHPTMKPVALVQGMIYNSSREEDAVLDLFGESGTTMMACEKTNRRAFLMELDPQYCDVIITRWQDFTGKRAIREDGRSFEEVDG